MHGRHADVACRCKARQHMQHGYTSTYGPLNIGVQIVADCERIARVEHLDGDVEDLRFGLSRGERSHSGGVRDRTCERSIAHHEPTFARDRRVQIGAHIERARTNRQCSLTQVRPVRFGIEALNHGRGVIVSRVDDDESPRRDLIPQCLCTENQNLRSGCHMIREHPRPNLCRIHNGFGRCGNAQ